VAGGVPDGEGEGAGEEGEDDPVLAELGGGDLQRAGQQVELVPAERPEEGAAAVGQFVAGDVRGGAQGDGQRQQRDVPVADGARSGGGARAGGQAARSVMDKERSVSPLCGDPG
jgi:hypothetical protein